MATSTTSASSVLASPPAAGSIADLGARAGRLDLGDLVAEMELEALLLQHALELLGDLAVHAGQDAVEKLDDRHLRAEPRARPSRAPAR